MNAKKMLLIAGLGIMTTIAVRAEDFFTDHVCFDPGAAVFQANEFSMDVFGFYGSLNRNGASGATWGPGVGGSYYVTRYFGLEGDTYADAYNNPYLANVNFIGRYPVGFAGFSPYGYFGIGRQWSYAAQWQANLGAGIEYRFAPKTGVFSDLRGVFTGETRNYLVCRFGIRFVF